MEDIMKNKPFLIIRRSGYYVNYIQNLPGSMKAWMENNLTRTEPKKVDGQYVERSLEDSMKVCCVSFTPATASEVSEAPRFELNLVRKFGMMRCL